MAMQAKKKIRKSKEPCYFCVNNKEPDYKEQEALKKYVSGRGMLINRLLTGICQKHQKRLARQVKRLRFLGLMA